MKKSIALIYGGRGAEAEISVMSAAFVYAAINRAKYEPHPIFISKSGFWFFTDGIRTTGADTPTYPVRLLGGSGFLRGGELLRVDLALPILHGDFGEDGIVQGALECAGIPYAGEGVRCGAICQSKAHTKLIARALGIKTADFVTARGLSCAEAAALTEDRIGYPAFVKPNSLGSSIGAHRAEGRAELMAAYAAASALCDEVLIEQAVNVHAELECAYFNDGQARLSTGGLIKTCGRTYGFNEKYRGAGEQVTDAKNRPSEECAAILRDACQRLIDAIGISRAARIDFFLTDRGEVLFNEINTLPGMTEGSLYPLMTEDMGLMRGEFVNRLIERGLSDARRI